jgi:hypothetical protein
VYIRLCMSRVGLIKIYCSSEIEASIGQHQKAHHVAFSTRGHWIRIPVNIIITAYSPGTLPQGVSIADAKFDTSTPSLPPHALNRDGSTSSSHPLTLAPSENLCSPDHLRRSSALNHIHPYQWNGLGTTSFQSLISDRHAPQLHIRSHQRELLFSPEQAQANRRHANCQSRLIARAGSRSFARCPALGARYGVRAASPVCRGATSHAFGGQ